MDELLSKYHKVKEYIYTKPNGKQKIDRKESLRYGYIRYADDILVTAQTKEDIEAIVPILKDWLAERGLELNEEKTKITNIGEGVKFLGFHIRQFKGSCYTLPQKEKILAFLAEIRTWLRNNISAKPEAIIHTLNQLLRGWGNYYKYGASKQMFKYVDHQVWKMLWGWARKRHPNKGKYWVVDKYFKPINGIRWIFNTTIKNRQGQTRTIRLVRLMDIAIERYIKVEGKASPDDPILDSYWENRQTRYGKTYWGKNSKLRYVAENQNWQCPVCGEHLFNGEQLNTHHIIPVEKGGTDRKENLLHLHKVCHQHLHQMGEVQQLLEA
ncbi:MAG: group II intron maturase-specific domain-containing protein [Acidobacteriota bacterium]